MLKLLHWCAVRMSMFAIWLYDKGGNLECWCDEQMYRRKWVRWGKKHNLTVTWVPVPKMDPSEFRIPMPGEYVPPKPQPITMLDGEEA